MFKEITEKQQKSLRKMYATLGISDFHIPRTRKEAKKEISRLKALIDKKVSQYSNFY